MPTGRETAQPQPPPPQPQPGAPAAVEYERPLGVAVARTLRLLLLVTLANTLLLGANLAGMRPWEFARQAYKDWSTQRTQRKAEAQRTAQLLAAQQACMQHVFPPKYIVYTEEPEEAMQLIGAGSAYTGVHANDPPPGWQTPAILRRLDCMTKLNQLRRTGSGGTGALFVHERRSPAGGAAGGAGDGAGGAGRRSAAIFDDTETAQGAMVYVGFEPGFKFSTETVLESAGGIARTITLTKSRTLRATVSARAAETKLIHTYELELVLPDSIAAPVSQFFPSEGKDGGPDPSALTTRPALLPPGNRLRFFGGQADPADASHFTIDYELDGRPGTIDGWLKADGIVLRPRAGRLLFSAGTPRWELK